MAIATKIQILLETLTPNFSKGLKDAGKEVQTFAKNVDGTIKGLSFDKGFNVAGVAQFADKLKSVSKGAEELATQLRTGTSYGRVFGSVMDNIPIVSQFKAAGEAIRELVTGEKAAAVEAGKLRDHVYEIAKGYREIAFERAKFGKYGGELAQAENDESKNKDTGAAQDERKKIIAERAAFVKARRESGNTPMTDAEKAQAKRYEDSLKLNNAKLSEIDDKYRDKEARRLRDGAKSQYEFKKSAANESDEFEAKMQEKALRRQGKGVESAIVAAKAGLKVKERDIRASASDFALADLASEADRQERRQIAAGQMARAQKETADSIADLKEEHDRAEQEKARDNEERLKEIRAHGNVERLKIEDEEFNAKAARRGELTRSHLAEEAQIEEDFRKQVAELEKKYREDKRVNVADRNDPTLKASIDAAAEERRQKLGGLSKRGDVETAKNFEESLREQRKLWESVGDAAQQYGAKVSEINEHHRKFGDDNLQAAELRKLNGETFQDLRKQFPEHKPDVSLYGRTGSYADLKVGGEGDDAAAKQLGLMQQQAQREQQRDVIWQALWDWLRSNGGASLPGIDILGI